MTEPEKLPLTSMDIADQRRQELKAMFPNVFSETENENGEIVESIDFEKLKSELGTFSDVFESRRERYGMDWPGKKDALQLIQRPSIATLRPDRGQSVDFENSSNVFIEGDNLEALKALQKSYYGKVKMVYIDPPYNTGKEFIYPDEYSESLETYLAYAGLTDSEGRKFSANTSTEGRFHTKWLNMMLPRLYLARNLLRDDGFLFVSIDDNELSRLMELLNGVFGEDNFIGVFSVNSTPNARDYGHIGKMHEYVLFFAKNIEVAESYLIPVKDKSFKYDDEVGGFNIHPLYNSNVAFHSGNRPNLYYPFYIYPDQPIDDSFFAIGLEDAPGAIKVYPPKSQKEGVQFVWRWGKPKSKEGLIKEIIGYQTGSGEYRIVEKMRHSAKLIRSLLVDKTCSTRKGTAEVEALFGKKVFSFPKPLALMKQLVAAATTEGDLILDLFAGSCSMAHAVYQINAETGQQRSCLSIQIPEPIDGESKFKTITEIGRERLRLARKEIEDSDPELFNQSADSLDLGFKAFFLDKSNFQVWNVSNSEADEAKLSKQLELHIEHVDEKSSQEDILYELLLKAGFMLTEKVETQKLAEKTVYSVADGSLLICLEDEISRELIDAVAEAEPMQFICLDRAFKGNDQLKANAVQTFAARNQGREKAEQIIFRTV